VALGLAIAPTTGAEAADNTATATLDAPPEGEPETAEIASAIAATTTDADVQTTAAEPLATAGDASIGDASLEDASLEDASLEDVTANNATAAPETTALATVPTETTPTAIVPVSQPAPRPAPRRKTSSRWLYPALGMTALVAAIAGVGAGAAVRLAPDSLPGQMRLDPEQNFPPRSDWNGDNVDAAFDAPYVPEGDGVRPPFPEPTWAPDPFAPDSDWNTPEPWVPTTDQVWQSEPTPREVAPVTRPSADDLAPAPRSPVDNRAPVPAPTPETPPTNRAPSPAAPPAPEEMAPAPAPAPPSTEEATEG
jgi:hypothetical protein